MRSAVEILKSARALIGDPSSWAQEDFARNRNGDPVESSDDTAVCFCAYGALNRVTKTHDGMTITLTGNRPRDIAIATLVREARGEYPGDLADFNDSASHSEVLALFDRAIARASA
jgi:hypothetical protein